MFYLTPVDGVLLQYWLGILLYGCVSLYGHYRECYKEMQNECNIIIFLNRYLCMCLFGLNICELIVSANLVPI